MVSLTKPLDAPTAMNRQNAVFTLPFAAFASIAVLAACGGGGDSGGTGSGTANTTQTTAESVTGDTVVVAAVASCNIAGFAQAMLDAVNQARASGRNCGTEYYPAVAALTWNTLLAQAAAGHSTDMANNNLFSHTGVNGLSVKDRIDATGYLGSYWGENIYAGGSEVDAAMTAWLASPGHCANIMNSNFKDFGAACAQNTSSTYGNYWTQDFTAPH